MQSKNRVNILLRTAAETNCRRRFSKCSRNKNMCFIDRSPSADVLVNYTLVC